MSIIREVYVKNASTGAVTETPSKFGIDMNTPGTIATLTENEIKKILAEEEVAASVKNKVLDGNGLATAFPPLIRGEGANSISSPTASATNERTIALGVETSAGWFGYYFGAVDFTNNYVYLSKTQCYEGGTNTPPQVTTDDAYLDLEFEDIGWTGASIDPETQEEIPGDWVSMTQTMKYDRCAQVLEVYYNRVKLSELPFTEIQELDLTNDELEFSDYTIANMTQPTRGIVEVGKFAYAEGIGSLAIGYESHAEGCYTFAYGRAAHTEGMLTEAAYTSHAEGRGSIARGYSAHAEGFYTEANKDYAHAEGAYSKADGRASHAEGGTTVASGNRAHAEGEFTLASGDYSHAEGKKTVDTITQHEVTVNTGATGTYAHSEGQNTAASNTAAHAEGRETIASGEFSHAEGEKTVASGRRAHAEGNNTLARENGAHAEGFQSQAIANFAHAEGNNTIASGQASHTEGNKTQATAQYSHAEGNNTLAKGNDAHAEGGRNAEKTSESRVRWEIESLTGAIGATAHAEGFNTSATGDYTHAEGQDTVATGKRAHAEGYGSVAAGGASHAEGEAYALGNRAHAEGRSKAEGSYSHAEGYDTYAISNYTHAGGRGVIAKSNGLAQTAIGQYNAENLNALFVVGNGESNSSRSNALEVLKDGSLVAADLTIDNMSTKRTIEKVKKIEAEIKPTLDYTSPSVPAWGYIPVRGFKIAGTEWVPAEDPYEAYIYLDSQTYGVYPGMRASLTLKGHYSNIEILEAWGQKLKVSCAGGMDITLNPAVDDIANGNVYNYMSIIGHPELGDIETGYYTTAFGNDSVAYSKCAFASGQACKALGKYAHAEGSHTEAGAWAHAEGSHTIAARYGAHAQGLSTKALGAASHAGGAETCALGYAQTAIGKFNKEYLGATSAGDTSGSIFIVGIGTSTGACANAFRVTNAGQCYGAQAFTGSGADYAEYYEWLDGNFYNEDRRGCFVTLEGNKIRLATAADDYILGVISSVPVVVGNGFTDMWQGMYLTDVFGNKLTEVVEVPEMVDEETEEVIPAHTETRFILNPEYDSTKEYKGRHERQEWAAVGTHGQLIVVDDGTCLVNSYCRVDDNGHATIAWEKTDYRVIERLDDTHIRIVIK